MDRDSAKLELKSRIEDVLLERGINPKHEFHCLNPNHPDEHPSMVYRAKEQRARCYACGVGYDTLDILGLDHGYTGEDGLDPARYNDVFLDACRRYGIALDDDTGSPTPHGKTKPKPQPINPQKDPKQTQSIKGTIKQAQGRLEDPRALHYLESRGISPETAKAYGLGYISEIHLEKMPRWEALIIPTSETTFTARNLNSADKKDRYRNFGEANLFNLEAIYNAERVHIVEGELDALSVIEAGGSALALGSTANADKCMTAIKQALESPYKPLKAHTLILSLDNDADGLKTAQKLRDGLSEILEPYGIELKTVNIAGKYKDANAALTDNPEELKEAVKKDISPTLREEYKELSASSRLIGFIDGISESVNTPAISTGFYYLDQILDGGLYEGLYLIPAITSLGKTTLAVQIADNISKSGQDVIYISLEMATNELIAKSISRHTFTLSVEKGLNPMLAKSTRGITDGKRHERYNQKEKDLISEAYCKYAEEAQNLYIFEGLGDISAEKVRKLAEDHRAITGNTPVIIIDYIQIMEPKDPRATDKQNMDWRVWELKALSRDLKTPVIALSSINRQNYEEEINLAALKESGALEYSSDTVLGIQLQGAGTSGAKEKGWVNKQMAKDPRHVEIKVLKNRNGKRGVSAYFDYYPIFNYFHEQAEPAKE